MTKCAPLQILSLMLLVAGCGEASSPSATPISTAAIVAAPTPEGAHPAIRSLADQGNPRKKLVSDPNDGVRQVVVDVSCPADQIVPCGAAAARAVGLWLAKHGPSWGEYQGEPVTDLLINVDPEGQFGGFNIMGAMPSTDTLESASMADILTMFRWNGAGENGEIAVAGWCGKPAQQRQTPAFCTAFFNDECSPEKSAAVVEACPRDLLRHQ